MIRNIIFDLGAVLLDIDVPRFKEEVHRLCKRYSASYQMEDDSIFDAYEKGEMSTTAFFETLHKQVESKVPIHELERAWSLILKEPFPSSMAFLKWANTNYSTYLLSNTNDAHRVHFDQVFDRVLGKGRFYELFQEVYYSHEMGLSKPNERIYREVLQQSQLNAEECLFIDDKAENIAGAKACGIGGWVFKGVDDWAQLKTYLHAKTT